MSAPQILGVPEGFGKHAEGIPVLLDTMAGWAKSARGPRSDHRPRAATAG